MIDTMLVKGLSVRREENHFNFDYVVTNDEMFGVRNYQHKYFLGYNYYYT